VNLNGLVRFTQKLPGQGRPIFLTCVYGLSAGVIAVVFQLSANAFYQNSLVRLSHQSLAVFLVGSFITITGTALIVGFLLNRFCREASGSGIPQLKLAFWKDFGFVPWRVVWVKFVAGVLSLGGGSSLGREGPSVQLGGALASNISGLFGEAKQRRRRAAAAGAAAGLAAAFNTPIAAIIFVLEEIIEDLNSRVLGSVLLASVIGAFVVHGLVGKQPAFTLNRVETPGWPVYVLTPVVGAVAALVGLLFQKLTLGLRQARHGFKRVPAWTQPAIGAILTWMIGAAVFIWTGHLGVFALGYEDLSAGLNLEFGWNLAAILLIAKLMATFLCYGFGGCGGIFSPTLFLGGMCGLLLAGLSSLVLPLQPADQIVLAVVGMSGCLGAVVGAPITGILIVFEMTHQFSLVPALMLGALVSQAVRRRITKHNFYETILLQDGHKLEHVIPPRDLRGWQELPISVIANFHPVTLRQLSEPEIRNALAKHPYQRFPVAMEGAAIGILTRKEAELALVEKRSPKPEPAVTCVTTGTVRELQSKLIESTSLIAILVDSTGNQVLGLVTLHDLLRAERAFGSDSE